MPSGATTVLPELSEVSGAVQTSTQSLMMETGTDVGTSGMSLSVFVRFTDNVPTAMLHTPVYEKTACDGLEEESPPQTEEANKIEADD